MQLGDRLRALREKKGLKQTEFAERMRIPNQNVSNYERGFRQPDYDTLKKFADFFEVSTDYLLGRTPTASPPVYQKAGISDERYNQLSSYQKEVLDFMLSSETLAFKEHPDDLLEALEDFEVYYEVRKQMKNKGDGHS